MGQEAGEGSGQMGGAVYNGSRPTDGPHASRYVTSNTVHTQQGSACFP